MRRSPGRVYRHVGVAITTLSLVAMAAVLFGPPELVPEWAQAPETPTRPLASSEPESARVQLAPVPVPIIGLDDLPVSAQPEMTAPAAPVTEPTSTPDTTPVQAAIPALSGGARDDWWRDLPASSPQMDTAPDAVAEPLPITRLRIRSASIDTDVIEAPLIEQPDGAVTWEVPKFVAGHAETTAGAGQPGNAVLFGHVTSLTLGNVFENLHKVHVGDVVEASSGPSVFDYQVVAVRTVPRTDSSIVDPSVRPTLTLVTCTGLWNPLLHDYMDRLVVVAERDLEATGGPY